MSECSCGCPDCPDTCECAERASSPPVDSPVDEGVTMLPALDAFIKGQLRNRLAAETYSKVTPFSPHPVVYREAGGEQIPVRYDPNHFGTRPLTTAEAEAEAQEQLRRRQIDPTELERLVMDELEVLTDLGWSDGEIRTHARRIIAIVQHHQP